MYETHFGLRRRPFRTTPDSECYYPATTHEQALATLLAALADDEGLCLVTGAPGTGKTMLCHRLLERLHPETTSIFLTNSHFGSRSGLLQAILFDLSLPYEAKSEQELRLALTEALLANYKAGRHTVLLVDEAQHLGADLLEELRLLGNLEARQGKALQVILLAQPRIWETLQQPELAALCQRLIVRVHLDPFPVHEAADYLVHQLRSAGGRADRILADEALELVARGTQGVPRLLNQAAQQALALTYRAGETMVDVEAALEALSWLGLDAEVENVAGQARVAEESAAAAGEIQVVNSPNADQAARADPEGTAASGEEAAGDRRLASPRRCA
jgi:type II secretory pathway predicted ATPase ExeA